MLNILKKVPIIEIIIILLLNIRMFLIGGVALVALALRFEDPVSQEEFYRLVKITISDFYDVGVCIAIYKNLFNLSLNSFFLKSVYYLKYHSKVLKIICVCLILLSPSFFFGTLAFSSLCFIDGLVLSLGFPLIVLFLIWHLGDMVKKIHLTLGKILIFCLVSILLSLLLALPGDMYSTFYCIKTSADFYKVKLYLILIVITFPLMINEYTKTIIEQVRENILIFLLCWGGIVYILIHLIPNDLLTFYLIYFSLLMLCMLIFAPLVLKLKLKNKILRKNIETEINKSY